VNSFLSATRAAFILALVVVIYRSFTAGGQAAAAERIRVGLATRDFGYLPLFAGIGASHLAADSGIENAYLSN
jgi:hypothetical protein